MITNIQLAVYDFMSCQTFIIITFLARLYNSQKEPTTLKLDTLSHFFTLIPVLYYKTMNKINKIVEQ